MKPAAPALRWRSCPVILLPLLALLLGSTATAQIVVDGDRSEWGSAGTQLNDPRGDARPHDLVRGGITEDFFNLFLFAEAASSLPFNSWHFNIMFDIDSNPSTGHFLNGVGGDVLFQGGALYEHVTEAGHNWSWRRMPSCTPRMAVGTGGRVMEIGFPKACLASPSELRITMFTDTGSQGVNDHLPDAQLGWMGYFPASRVPSMSPRLRIFSHHRYLCYYGQDFSLSALRQMINYHVIALDARYATPAAVAYLQRHGVQPKYVLGYISVGEEHKQPEPVRMSGAQTGPVYFDPTDGQVKFRNLGYATYYVDSVQHEPWHGDGVPDANPNFLGRYIYPDGNWIWRLKTQRLSPAAPNDGSRAGFDQMLGPRRSDDDTDRTQNYGLDGLFLDTLDTAGHWNTPLYYPWMAPAYRDMIAWMRQNYPSAILQANRGVFFYNPFAVSPVYRTRPFDSNIAPFVDIALYESYSLDSNRHVPGISPFFCDNHCVYGPKFHAAAQAHNLVLSGVQYHMDRSEQDLGHSIWLSVQSMGWLDYVSRDGALFFVDHYVMDRIHDPVDNQPPQWRNAGIGWCQPQCRGDGTSGECCNPWQMARTGLQRAVELRGENRVQLQFDLAVDRSNPVFYNVYRSWDGNNFERAVFNAPLSFTWEYSDGQYGSLPFQVVQDLDCSRTQHFRIRAQDAHGNEDGNTNTIAFTCGTGMAHSQQPGRRMLRRRLSWADHATAEDTATLGEVPQELA